MEQYYSSKANEWSSMSTPEYVEAANRSLKLEEEIAAIYYPRSAKIIINRIEQIIIMQQSENLVNNEASGLSKMLTEKKDEEMRSLFKLFHRVPETLEHIARKLSQYIIYHGSALNNLSESRKNENMVQKDIASEYISKAFLLKKESDHMMIDIFANNLVIQKARDNAFQTFLNKSEKSTFFLATHADIILKQDNLQNEQEIEERVQEIVGIFVYFYSRDSFFKHYQKFFSNRLLGQTSKNKEAEKLLIARFKTEAGQTGVNKIETMLKDINNSDEFSLSIRRELQAVSQIELSVNVLTTGSWPITNPTEECNITQVMKPLMEKFEALYKAKHKGRNMKWLFSQGTAELLFRAKDKFLLLVSSYQMLALLVISSQKQSVSYSQLTKISGIPEADLSFQLMPLVKLKVLNKSDEGEEFKENSMLEINITFLNKQKKIRCIPGGKQAQVKKQKEDDEGRQQFVEEMTREREFVVDACIVRVMKSRRVMKHNELYLEVIKLTHNFKPDIPVIKRRIESLLEREYLKRDDTDRNTFIYVP